ncbi:hypothetical protein JCM3774_001826 [Rhodotorula dairenensis]
MGTKGLHQKLLKIARQRQLRRQSTDFLATRPSTRKLYDVICNHSSTQQDTPFIFLRDYNTLAVQWRYGWLRAQSVRRLPTVDAVQDGMGRAERDYFRQLDEQIRAALGADTIIINIVDGPLRPAAKKTFKPRPRRKEKQMRCGKNREELVAASRAGETYSPTYLDEDTQVTLVAAAEADQTIEILLDEARKRRAGQGTTEANASVEQVIAVLAAIPPSNVVVQSSDSDELVRSNSSKRFWTTSIAWHGKLEHLEIDPATSTAKRTGTSRPSLARPAMRPGAPPRLERNPRQKTGAPKPKQLGAGRPRHILIYHPGLDLVLGTTDEDERMKMALACGQDYSGRGIPGITWHVALSGLADDVFRLDWSRLDAAAEIASTLARLGSRRDAERAWRQTGRNGPVKRIPPYQVDDELVEILRAGLNTFRGHDAAIPMVAASSVKRYDRGPFVFEDLAPPAVRVDRRTDARSHKTWRLRPGLDHQVPSDPQAPQPLESVQSNPRLDHPFRLAPRSPPQPTPTGSFPGKPQVVHQVCYGPGPSLVEAAKRYGGGPPETVAGAHGSEEVEEDEDHDVDLFGADDGTVESRRNVSAAKARQSKAKHPQLSTVFGQATSPMQSYSSIVRKIVVTNKVVFASGVPEGVRTVAPNAPTASPAGRSVATPASPAATAQGTATAADPAQGFASPSTSSEVSPATGNGMAGESDQPARKRQRSGAAKRNARKRWLFKDDTPRPQLIAGQQHSQPPPVSKPESASEPRHFVITITPLLQLVNYLASAAAPFMQASWLKTVLDGLDQGESGYLELGDLAQAQNGVSQKVGRMAGIARPGGEKGVTARSRVEQEQLVNAATEQAGHIAPARMNVSIWSRICEPMNQNIGQVARRRLQQSLRHLGRTVASDMPHNARYALKGVLRGSHRVLLLPADFDLALDAITRAGSIGRLEKDLGEWFGNLLVFEVFRYARAEAGAEESTFAIPGSRTAPSSSSRPIRVKGTTKVPKGSGTAALPTTTTATTAGAPPLPPFAPGDDRLDDLEDIIRRALRPANDPRSNALAMALTLAVSEVANRLLAYRDRVVWIQMVSLKAGLKPPSVSAPGVSDTENSADTGDDEESADDEDLGDDEDSGDDEATPDGKTLAFLMKNRSAKYANGEKLSATLFTLDAQIRRMAGRSDEETIPTFEPTYKTADVDQLLRLFETSRKKDGGLERLDWVLSDAVDIGTQQLRKVLPSLSPSERSVLLEPLKTLFEPEGATWTEVEREPDWHRDVKLRIQARIRFELVELEDWLRHALSIANGSLTDAVERQGLSAEVINLVFDRTGHPASYIGTGRIVFSASAVRLHCVNIGSVQEEKLHGNEGSTIGEFFVRRCQQPFSELWATQVDKHRVEDVHELRHKDGQPMLCKIVPLAARGTEKMKSLAEEVFWGQLPTPQPPPKKYGRRTTNRQNRRGLARWSRRIHPAALEKSVKQARAPFKTVKGLNAKMPNIRDEAVRDATKEWLGTTRWSDITVAAIDKGEANTVAVFASSPTSAPGYEGRAESTIFYSSASLLGAFKESVRQGHRFRNRLLEELDDDIADRIEQDQLLGETIDVLHALNATNEWRTLRCEVERRAELMRCASQILDGVIGTRKQDRTKTREELDARKLLVFVGDGGGGVRKGSRGPNAANRLVRELELEAEARGVNAMFLLVPETLTSQRCSKPWCRDSEGRRSR